MNCLYRGKMNLPDPIRDEYSIKRHMENILKKSQMREARLRLDIRSLP
jgi:hypothetical protein